MLDTFPGDIRNVQQAIQSTQVHERAVVRKIFHYPCDDLTFLKILKQGASFFLHLLLDDSASGDNHIVAALIQFDHLELKFPVFKMR